MAFDLSLGQPAGSGWLPALLHCNAAKLDIGFLKLVRSPLHYHTYADLLSAAETVRRKDRLARVLARSRSVAPA
jgi:hypothetical protein